MRCSSSLRRTRSHTGPRSVWSPHWLSLVETSSVWRWRGWCPLQWGPQEVSPALRLWWTRTPNWLEFKMQIICGDEKSTYSKNCTQIQFYFLFSVLTLCPLETFSLQRISEVSNSIYIASRRLLVPNAEFNIFGQIFNFSTHHPLTWRRRYHLPQTERSLPLLLMQLHVTCSQCTCPDL